LNFWEEVAEKWHPKSFACFMIVWPLQASVLLGLFLKWLEAPDLAGWNLAWYGLAPWYLFEWFVVIPRWRSLRSRLELLNG
jgi:hypothetical protein